MLLLHKITKCGMLRGYISSKGGLFLLNGPKGVVDLTIVRVGMLRRETRSKLEVEGGGAGRTKSSSPGKSEHCKKGS